MQTEPLVRILRLLRLAERLKTELRHSWLSDGRQESVAEHTWRVSLMAVLVAPHLAEPVELERVLKMVVIHDLVEAEAGDVPVWVGEEAEGRRAKTEREGAAIARIRDLLGGEAGDELFRLWHEFEARATPEARFVGALDKLEAQIQHNEADLATWIEYEQLRVFGGLDEHCGFDPALDALRRLVCDEAVAKLRAGGLDPADLQARARER